MPLDLKDKKLWAGTLLALFVCSVGVALAAYQMVFKNPGFLFEFQKTHPFIFDVAKTSFKVTDLFFLNALIEKDEVPVLNLMIDEDKLVEMKEALPDKLKKKADLYVGDKHYEVKVKYRGASTMHWINPKKSIRFYLADEEYFNGTNVFNLVLPEDRGYFFEDFSGHVAEKLGLPVLKSDYYKLQINGKKQGLYYFLEEPSKPFLERNGLNSDGNLYKNENHDQNATTVFENPGYWLKFEANPGLAENDSTDLATLLTTIAQGEHPENIVDIDNFLHYNAHAILMNSNHENSNSNLVAYFDPSRGKFIFVPWDTIPASSDPLLIKGLDLVPPILSNSEFLYQRNKILWDYVSNEDQLKDDLAYIDQKFNYMKAAFYKDRRKEIPNLTFKKWWKEYKRLVTARYASLKTTLRDSEAHLNFEWVDSQTLGLEISSMGFSSVAMTSDALTFKTAGEGALKVYRDSNGNGHLDPEDQLLEGEDHLASGRSYQDHDYSERTIVKKTYNYFVRWEGGHFDPMTYDQGWKINLKNAITGDDAEVKKVFTRPEVFKDFDALNVSKQQFKAKYPFIAEETVLEGQIYLTIKAGQHPIHQNVIVPSSLNILIQPGAQLVFEPGISFISYGKVLLLGTEKSPVVLKGTGSAPWGVFAINGEGGNGSRLEFLKANGGGDALINGTYYSGMVSAHFADVAVKSAIIENSFGDDGMNLKNGHSSVTNSIFRDTHFDALDLDFVEEGTYTHNLFYNAGNDAIDIGGGSPLIAWSTVYGCGDKGVSIGEKTSPLVYEVTVENCVMGAGIKDGAAPLIVHSTFKNNQTGVATYVKKPLFGGGRGEIYTSTFENNGLDLSLDQDSTLLVSDCNYDEKSVEGGENIRIEKNKTPVSNLPYINLFLKHPNEVSTQ